MLPAPVVTGPLMVNAPIVVTLLCPTEPPKLCVAAKTLSAPVLAISICVSLPVLLMLSAATCVCNEAPWPIPLAASAVRLAPVMVPGPNIPPFGAFKVIPPAPPLIAALIQISPSALRVKLLPLLHVTASTTLIEPVPNPEGFAVDTITDDDANALCNVPTVSREAPTAPEATNGEEPADALLSEPVMPALVALAWSKAM